MCVCQYIFTSLFRSWLNACHPPSPVLRSSRFNPPYAPLDNPVPSVRGSRTTCTSCSQKSHVHHSHTVHICAVCAVCAACAASRAVCSASRAARACSFSVSRCSCLFVLLRLSWRRTVEVGVEFQCIQLSHGVDVCFVLWRCRPHRIFMWGNTNIL